MRNFEVTLTYKSELLRLIETKNIYINQQKIINVELDDSHCYSPEEFCNSIMPPTERIKVVRINVREKPTGNFRPLNWLSENFGRIYLHNGIPLILNKN